jgi:recombinational DNA repair protein (RecF pathway)
MARGVRKEKSKLAGGIELFAITDVVVGEGKGDLGILTSAKLEIFFRHILEEYDRLQFGYQSVKLVARASETVDEPEWFDLLAETLAGIDVLTIPLSLIETWFYSRYAGLLGHDLNLDLDVDGDALEVDAHYRYDAAEQGLRKITSGEVTSEHIKLLRLIATRPLKVLIQIGGINDLISDCLRIVREHAAIDIT